MPAFNAQDFGQLFAVKLQKPGFPGLCFSALCIRNIPAMEGSGDNSLEFFPKNSKPISVQGGAELGGDAPTILAALKLTVKQNDELKC